MSQCILKCECEAGQFCKVFNRVQSVYAVKVCRNESETLTPEQCEVIRQNWLRIKDKPVEVQIVDPKSVKVGFTEAEVKELFPDIDDPTLLGNRIEKLTKALGWPPCNGCDKRKEWINKAHLFIRNLIGE
jgi:hypothetical protein